MGLKRKARSALCGALAATLVLTGRVNKAKRKSLAPGVILPVYFHNPNKKLFRQTVAWLKKNGYSFISCDQLIDILEKKAPCPPGAVWVSLDDGWQQNIDNVIPIAAEYDVPVTIFICTGAVETGTFWWEDVNRYAAYLPAELNESWKIRKLKEQKRKEILKSIERHTRTAPREALTIEDIKNITAMPQVTLGAHTLSHPVLTNCTDPEVEYELGESKKKLEQWINKPVKAFAYPNGAFDDRVKKLLAKHGYKFAATTERKFGSPDCDRYLFPRTDVMDDGTFTENLCHLLGIWEPFIGSLKRIVKPGR